MLLNRIPVYLTVSLLLSTPAVGGAEILLWDELTGSKPATREQMHRRYFEYAAPQNMTVEEKKQRFLQLIVPVVKGVYAELHQQYEEAKAELGAGKRSQKIEQLKAMFENDSEEDLLARLKPHPVSIVLAQAAMESNWATSRFFVEAKNLFGVWSFNQHEPRIAANKKRGNKTIWLKKYRSLDNAVRDHYKIMARGAAYARFRELRLLSANPLKLVEALDRYSETGKKYGKKLAAIIRYNQFEQFDD